MPQLSRNPEVDAINEWLKEDTNVWIAIASAFLERYERDIAVGKLTNALRYLMRDGPPSPDTLGGRLFRTGSKQIDYHAVAIQIALTAESNALGVHKEAAEQSPAPKPSE